ncbi:MAG: DNA gyrase subunit B, partial [Nanoarchaeota archaeon]|nr:DNA gyrase subunit B [Nanoarchaeota archaeon]
MVQSEGYSAESIKVLEGLEGVRKRPAMYIGSTGKEGLHHLVYEAVDNSVDEALAGFCKKIIVKINKDGSVSVEDDGRGIPVDPHPQLKIPAVQVALTKLHAGGKFDKKSYQISGGLHGVGISCVNALSEKLIVEVKRNGKIFRQEYSRGNAKTKLSVVGKCNSDTGTTIIFWPDKEIFSTTEFDGKFLEIRFRELAFLNAGLKIILINEVKGKQEEFYASGGLLEFVKWLNHSKEVLSKPIYFKREIEETIVEVGIQYNSGYQENIFGFVNTINTVEGGTHVSGFKTALTRVINDYARKKNLLKNDSLLGDDVREGLTAVISIKIPEPQFEGQTKTKLGNSDIKGFVDSVVTSALTEFFEENPVVAKKIVSKSLNSARARLAAKKAKDLIRRKNAFSLGGLPGKLHDCSSKKSEDTELYIVEGESAGGSAKNARDKNTQAILPLKGKILNVEKSNPARTLSSEEITNMITAIGTGVGEQFDLKRLRYGKIIIMSVDGKETTFIRNSSGDIQFVKIGEFIDKCKNNQINFKDYEVLCFGIKNNQTQFKKIKSVISHPIEENMFEIRTSYGRSVRVTSSHSVFVLEKNKIKLKKGNEIEKGDFIVAPKNLSLYREGDSESIDVLELLMKNAGDIKDKIYVRGKSVEELLKRKIIDKYGKNHKLTEKRVFIPKEIREVLTNRRKLKKFSQLYICNKIGIKQPCVYYDWEKGKKKPLLSNFKKYLVLLDIREEEILPYVKIESSILENLWSNYYSNSGRNKVKDYIEFSKLSFEDIEELGKKLESESNNFTET